MSVIVRQAYEHLSNNQITQNANMSGWSFLQFLSETKHIVQNREDDTNKTPYVHPIEKRPVAKLSLEMCTESLGTENGSESGDEISLLAIEATNMSMIPLTTKPNKVTNFTVRENSFPPPLNTSVNYSRMVKSYEEDGRLVVQAISVCSPPRCFVSERREGRLRLCLLSQDEDKEFEENESEVEAFDEEDGEEDDPEEEEEEEEEGILGNNENFEGKIGNKKFRRSRRRFNENGHEAKTMLNRKQQQQFWVTT